ncbi:MAG: hypothetical protein WA971_10605 [Microbacterium sp.]
MSDAGGLSRRARTRIGGFSLLLGILGTIAVVVIGWYQLAPADAGGIGGDRLVDSGDYYYPWENPAPVAASSDDGGTTWHGRGQQYIPLDGLDPAKPLVIEYDRDGPVSDISFGDGSGRPVSFTTYSDGPCYVVTETTQGRLWLRTRTTEAWTVTVRPADLPDRSGTVSGVEGGAFLYRGGATTGRLSLIGDYSVSVDIVTAEGVQSERLRKSGSIAWGDGDTAVFLIEAYTDTAWSIEFHEPAPPATSTPTVGPTTEPTTGSEPTP